MVCHGIFWSGQLQVPCIELCGAPRQMSQIKMFIVELSHSVMKTTGGKSLHKIQH